MMAPTNSPEFRIQNPESRIEDGTGNPQITQVTQMGFGTGRRESVKSAESADREFGG